MEAAKQAMRTNLAPAEQAVLERMGKAAKPMILTQPE
jgi:hypothetical protein